MVIKSFTSDLYIFIEYCFRMRQAIESLTQRMEELEKSLHSLKKIFKHPSQEFAAEHVSDHESSQKPTTMVTVKMT